MEVRIYLTNLAKYNQGSLVGKWVDLPLDPDELEKELKSVLGEDEEYFITDYDAPFIIHEYENMNDLNDFAEKLDGLDEHDQHRVVHLLDTHGFDWEQALESYEEVTFYTGMDLADVAEELVEEGIFGDIPESIQGYLDYDKIARDLRIDGYYEKENGTFHFQ